MVPKILTKERNLSLKGPCIVNKDQFLANWKRFTNGVLEGLNWCVSIICLFLRNSNLPLPPGTMYLWLVVLSLVSFSIMFLGLLLIFHSACIINPQNEEHFASSDIDLFIYGINSDAEANRKVCAHFL